MSSEKALAIIYTFLPYVDTAGIVFAKRIQAEIKKEMTVISCKAYGGATLDHSLEQLTHPYLKKTIEIDAKFTYRDWKFFENFYNKALEAAQHELDSGVKYTELYSRSMSVISHLVAYKIKQRNPFLKWIAEFSDPIIKDVTGDDRKTLVPEEWLAENLDVKSIQKFKQYNNLFSLSEILVYLYADEIKFTNPLQKKFMINYISEEILDFNFVPKFNKTVDSKGVIVSHPVLESKFYNLGKFDMQLDQTKTNIAYFGNVNAKRSFNSFFDSWLILPLKERNKFRFYIFSNLKKETILKHIPDDLQDYIVLGGNLNYLDFLTSLKNFDYLLTMDTEVNHIFGMNPFLPSKVADYLGSGTKLLALIEKGSPTDLIRSEKILKFEFENFDINTI